MILNNEYTSEKSLLTEIQSGNKKAFETLYRGYYPKLCNYLYRFIHTQDICEELVQDLFLNIWINRKDWEPKGTIVSYLFKSAKHRAFDYLKHLEVENKYLRSQHIEISSGDLQWDSVPAGVLVEETRMREKILESEIDEAILKLSPKTRMIFKLSREDGLTYLEIAEFLDLSIKTIETQMGRALYQLRSQLSHLLLVPFIISTCLLLALYF